VQGAFRVPAEGKAEVAGRRLILIDDVLTSGATSDACARTLLRRAPAVSTFWCSRGLSTLCAPPYKLVVETAKQPSKTPMAPVEIYTTPYCPFCVDAKALLKKKNVDFTEIDVSRDRELRVKMIHRANGRTTVPQIFIGAVHVGGCDDLYELEGEGKLDPLLNGQASA